MAAASEGVARPKMIEPSAAPISNANGANEVSNAHNTVLSGMLRSAAGNCGASCGCRVAMRIV